MRLVMGANNRRMVSALMAAAVATSTTVAYAQSTDKDHPTHMTSGEIKGVETGKETDYYYSFVGGPGEVVLTLDGKKAAKGFTMVEIQLFDADFNYFRYIGLSDAANPAGRTVERINISPEKTVIMKITPKAGNWGVRVSGAVKFADSLAPVPAAATPLSAALASPDNNRLACIPRSGILRIEMEDGSAQEINMTRVRRVFVKP